jgi:hypothetical protein
MTLLTVVGVALIAVGIGLTGYGDGLRRASRACANDPSTTVVIDDPRAVTTLRRGVALMAIGLAVAGLGAL